MKAVRYDHYGDASVLTVADREAPTASANDVLIDVVAAALNPKDILIRKGKFKILAPGRFPRSCGYDFSGVEVESGREVFGMINGMLGRTCAEQIVVAKDELAKKPEKLDHHGAASLALAGQTALQALRDDGRLVDGQRAVINGASGGVGTLAIQIAKALGAHVTAICSAKNRELCSSLGADDVVAYDEGDALEKLGVAHVFFDVFGDRSLAETKDHLTRDGTYVSTVPSRGLMVDVARTVLSPKRARLVVVRSRRADLETLAHFVETDRLHPVVDRTYPMAEIADAHRYIETRRARGKVTITIGT